MRLVNEDALPASVKVDPAPVLIQVANGIIVAAFFILTAPPAATVVLADELVNALVASLILSIPEIEVALLVASYLATPELPEVRESVPNMLAVLVLPEA